MPAGYSFRPRAWTLALAAAGCAAGIALGNWQTERAAQKRAAAAAVERLELRGEFEPKYTVFLDNKIHRGRPGYDVVQPLRIAGGKTYMLVDRGWSPAGVARDRLPAVRTPAGEVSISGVRLKRFPQAYAPAAAKPDGNVWQNVTVEAFSAWSGLALEPSVLEQHSALDDGLLREWPRADDGVAMHESYALQWYSLAALSIVLFLALNLKRAKSSA